MTVFLPLEASTPLPSSPSFLAEPTDYSVQLSKVLRAILKAKRIVVICGAGISVQAGIPDFRSSEGLFKPLKRDNPREAQVSGKDLFDASVFNSEHTTSLFCQMIARLAELSQAAQPTAFHQILKTLDERGKLLRVYTQNIDAIEQKSGLSFGVPVFEDKRCKPRSKGNTSVTAGEKDCSDTSSDHQTPALQTTVPRSIPLHGTLQMLHCQICTFSFPLQDYMPSLALGQPPQCPECTSVETMRQLIGKRARGIGKLRPSVVLYNEDHKDGEGVGEVVRKDLIGASKGKGRSGADLLLVVGTSLRVPGTKRMVREFSKAVHSRGTGSPNSSVPSSPAPSPRRSPSTEEKPPLKALYLNLDFPVPTREWEGVFDAWIQGDAQQFAEMLQVEIERELEAKEIATEKKRRREEEAAEKERVALEESEQTKPTIFVKRKASESLSHSAKRRKVSLPPTPPKSPFPVNGKNQNKHSVKFYVRIPPISPCVSKVIVSTPAPQRVSSRRAQPPITPEPPPRPPRPSPPKLTKTRRKAERTPRTRRSPKGTSVGVIRNRGLIIAPSTTPQTSQDDHEDIDIDADILPVSFVRTIQYGLRSSEG